MSAAPVLWPRAARPPRKKPVQHERPFHITVAGYLDAALPEDWWWTTFPAGGGGKARGGQLKAMGLKPGVSDILVLYLYRVKGADPSAWRVGILWIELKSKDGRLSKPQRAFARTMARFPGVVTAKAKTLEEVEAALRLIGLIPRVRLMAGGAWIKDLAA